MKSQIAKLVKEKKSKLFAINKEKSKLKKQMKFLDLGFKKKLKKALAKLSYARKKELKKLKKQLKSVSFKLGKLEKSHDSFVQKAVAKIDDKYAKDSDALDMKLAMENDKLQKANKKFRKQKLKEKAIAKRKFKKFLAEKKRFKASINAKIKKAQAQRDAKIAARQKQRAQEQKRWDNEAKLRQKSFASRTSSLKNRIASITKKIDEISGKIDSLNNLAARKLDDLKAKLHDKETAMQKKWTKKEAAKKKWFKEQKAKIVLKYDNMELSDKKKRESDKKSMQAKREKLLKQKNARKAKRQAKLEKEKMKWQKYLDKYKNKLAKLQDKLEQLKDAYKLGKEKDIQNSKKKKVSIQKQYLAKIDKLNAKELKEIKRKFKKPFKIERKRIVVPSGVTKSIEAKMAEAEAQLGLKYLASQNIKKARKAFVYALYLDEKNKTAKDGLKAISKTAKALYWNAFGMKDTNKYKAKKILKNLLSSLLPTNPYFLKAKSLLDDLK